MEEFDNVRFSVIFYFNNSDIHFRSKKVCINFQICKNAQKFIYIQNNRIEEFSRKTWLMLEILLEIDYQILKFMYQLLDNKLFSDNYLKCFGYIKYCISYFVLPHFAPPPVPIVWLRPGSIYLKALIFIKNI